MAQQKGAALQDPFLNVLRKERIPVAIYLVNGIKLQGQVESFDPHTATFSAQQNCLFLFLLPAAEGVFDCQTRDHP